MKAEEIKELAKLFDSKLTKHPVSSEELQSVLTDFGTILIVNLTTTQPQPKLSAEDIDKLVEKYELNVDSFTSCFLVDKDILINICNEYRNQPTPFTPQRTEQEEADRLVELFADIDFEDSVLRSIQVVSYHRDNLKLRGLSTEFEEKVLTILKGM